MNLSESASKWSANNANKYNGQILYKFNRKQLQKTIKLQRNAIPR